MLFHSTNNFQFTAAKAKIEGSRALIDDMSESLITKALVVAKCKLFVYLEQQQQISSVNQKVVCFLQTYSKS